METLEQTVEDRTRDFRLAKEEAEFANAAKSDFLATMSHEIRTPMNGMMVMAEMLASADLSSRHRRYAEIITRSGASLLTIINDILDLSKIEAGKLDLESVPFSPERMVEDVASLFWEKARSKGLDLAVRIAPDVPLQVIGDPTRLNQVITNLVNNALKFTETGGVTIDVTSEADGANARLRFAVTDTGVGIEQSRIGAIFEAFSQADQSTTRRFGGTGLGLTVCKRLVDAMAGEIVVTSEIGKGSTFATVVSLPVDEAAPGKPDLNELRFALSLPSPVMRGMVETALNDLGITARMIRSPREAASGEIVLCLSELLARTGGAAGAIHVCLTDVGDSHADGLIREGHAADLLPLPLGRLALWEFMERAKRDTYRGTSALASANHAGPGETFGHLSILAVDDNAVNREVLREALLSLGAEGDFVGNGAEAVEAAAGKAYDVIFMDGSMPEMDGFTATQRIREAEMAAGGKRAFVVALTAQVRGADAEAWAKAGADRHMTKPFTATRLMEALKDAGAGTRTISAPEPAPLDDVKPAAQPVDEIFAHGLPMIDQDAVATMESVGQRNGRDVVGKVWKLFLGQAPDAAFKLETLAQGGIPAAIAKQAHFLKSMALSAGATQVADHCERIEAAGNAGDLIGARDLVQQLRTPLDGVCAAMKLQLEDRAARAAV
jgi:signal transduction histidine kinase/DNA-binding NarL/FixJ family response regulator/HPt (histidine-containing phosphotransfer) domain-containing protein